MHGGLTRLVRCSLSAWQQGRPHTMDRQVSWNAQAVAAESRAVLDK